MITGSTTKLTKTLTRPTAFTSTNPTAAIVAADGASTPVTVAVESAVALFIHTFSVEFQLSAGGPYTLVWTLPASDGTTTILTDDLFVTQNSVIPIINDRLQIDESVVDIVVLERAVMTTGLILLARYTDVVDSYQDITYSDKILFDSALGIMSAAYLRPFMPKTTPTGDLISNKIGPDEYRYSDVNAYTSKPLDPLETRWFAEAQLLLDAMSMESMVGTTDVQLFVACGPRRAALAALSLSASSTPDYKLWGNDLVRYEWTKNFIGEYA